MTVLGGPYVFANLEGHQSNLLFWWWDEAETQAKRGPSPKLYITILLSTRCGFLKSLTGITNPFYVLFVAVPLPSEFIYFLVDCAPGATYKFLFGSHDSAIHAHEATCEKR